MKEKHRKKLKIGITILLSVLVVSFLLSIQSAKVVIKGFNITIDKGSDHVEGLLAQEQKYDFIMKDLGVEVNSFSGNAFAMMIPYNKAEKLRRKYGDFFKPNAPGSAESMKNLQSTVLITDSDSTKKNIDEAVNLVKKSRIPVINFTGSRIVVSKQKYFGINSVENARTVLYYVKSFTIVKPNYL